jgi:uncharacterized protein YbjT (DUF2867 family)
MSASTERTCHEDRRLSVVGTERLPGSGYMRAKAAEEKLIEDSPIPWSIVYATQFFEFIGRIADEATSGGTVRLAPASQKPATTTG